MSFLFRCLVLTELGYVPSPFVPDVEGAAVPLHQEPHNNSSQLRQCDKCCTYKPPRAHHCKICRRCVLRMDHHCLWVNNLIEERKDGQSSGGQVLVKQMATSLLKALHINTLL